MKIFTGISSTQLRHALAIREKIEVLESKLNTMLGGSEVTTHQSTALPRKSYRKRRKMSPEGQARMAASMKARWRKAKKAGRSSL